MTKINNKYPKKTKNIVYIKLNINKYLKNK